MSRALIPCVAAIAVVGCSPKPELPRPEVWVQFAYFSGFDPMSTTHVIQTLKNLGIEWRAGKEGWRGYYIDIRDRDRSRALAALSVDEQAGNIDALVGFDSPEPKQESIRRPAAELLKSPRFAEGTIEGSVFRIPEIQAALKECRHVDWVALRLRTYLGEDNLLHRGLEGEVLLAAALEEDIGGHRFSVYVWKDGKSAETRGSVGPYWRGDPETIKANKEKYGIPR